MHAARGLVESDSCMQVGLASLRQVPASGHESWEPPAAVVQPNVGEGRCPGEPASHQDAANFEDLARIFEASAGRLGEPGSRSSSPDYSPSEDSRGAAGTGMVTALWRSQRLVSQGLTTLRLLCALFRS